MTALKHNNLIIIYTGHGKGKTTAALGLALRAVREKMKVMLVQFIKSEKWSGEVSLKKVLPQLEVKCFGTGFVKSHQSSVSSDQDKKLKNIIKKGLEYSKNVIKSKKYSVIILDEIFVAYDLKLIKLSDIMELIKEFREKCQSVKVPSVRASKCLVSKCQNVRILVLTGRGCPKSLYKYADLVTEMKEVKHQFQKGIKAIKGIDF